MQLPDDYICEGQISIFDLFPEDKTEVKGDKPKAICKQKDECQAYGCGCGGTIEPCRFGGPFVWMNPPVE